MNRPLHLQRTTILSLALFAAVLLLYRGTFSYPLILLDDRVLIADSPMIRGGLAWHSILDAFRTCAGQWMPLTWLSFMAEVSAFGFYPGEMHALNVLLHAANAVLLFLWLRFLTGRDWPSFAVAAIFAAHPINVESVAWVIERKNVLSMFLALLSLMAYCAHARKPARPWLPVSLCLFALSVSAKPLAIPLPLLFILLDWWPLRRISCLTLAEKLPFLSVCLVDSLLCLKGASGEHIGGPMPGAATLAGRILHAFVSYCASLGQLFVPAHLVLVYPYPAATSVAVAGGSLCILAGLLTIGFRVRGTAPQILFGTLWYLLALLPTSGLIQVGAQARADRFTYLGQIGVLVAVVWTASALLARHRPIAATALAVALAALCLGASRQIALWSSTAALFGYSAALEPECAVNVFMVGWDLEDRNEPAKALPYLERAASMLPRFSDAWSETGRCLLALGRYGQAEDAFDRSLTMTPRHSRSWAGLGDLRKAQGRTAEAITCYRTAARLNPAYESLAAKADELAKKPPGGK